MGPSLAVKPIDLLPSRPQTFWGWPAVLNFFLGGLGAGFYVVTVLAEGPDGRSAVMTLASWLAPACVLAGFAAVAAEAGRPLRGPRVLLRVGTSWMSRELWLGGAFVAARPGRWAPAARPAPRGRRGGRPRARDRPGLHRAGRPRHPGLERAGHADPLRALGPGVGRRALPGGRGRACGASPRCPRWPPSSCCSSEASGCGCATSRGRARPPSRRPSRRSPVAARRASWWGPASWRRSCSPPGPPRGPRSAAPALALAGILMVLGQLHAKARLVLTAGRLRPVTLAGLRIKGRSR